MALFRLIWPVPEGGCGTEEGGRETKRDAHPPPSGDRLNGMIGVSLNIRNLHHTERCKFV